MLLLSGEEGSSGVVSNMGDGAIRTTIRGEVTSCFGKQKLLSKYPLDFQSEGQCCHPVCEVEGVVMVKNSRCLLREAVLILPSCLIQDKCRCSLRIVLSHVLLGSQ